MAEVSWPLSGATQDSLALSRQRDAASLENIRRAKGHLSLHGDFISNDHPRINRFKLNFSNSVNGAKSLKILNTCFQWLAWGREGFDNRKSRISREGNFFAHDKHKRAGEQWNDSFYEVDPRGGDPNGPGAGGSGGGSPGWHWSSSGDEGSDWFPCLFGEGQAYILLLLGLLKRQALTPGARSLISALLLQLFFYGDLIAIADGITSPLRPSLDGPVIDESKVSRDKTKGLTERDAVFEVKGGIWRRLLIDAEKDEFVVDPIKENDQKAFAANDHAKKDNKSPYRNWRIDSLTRWGWDIVRNLMLPDGYPNSVTGDYLDYTLWRMGQNIASQINGVLTTQALLYAVGLGKGAIPTAAAVNWVLKDGIGYLSKIMLAKYGRHFDVHSKGWRLLADLIENASYALELLTPVYPHLFVYLGAAAGAGRSAAGLIQAATRSCFYAGFAAQRNFAEVIAKGEAQGMVSKSLGIALGIAISGYAGASGPKLVATFLTVTGIHMFCNLRSYQALQLRTLNPYRASLVFCEYIRSGVVASVEEVNAEEPIFVGVPFPLFKLKGHKDNGSHTLSSQTKGDAAVLASKLVLGASFASLIKSQREADELFQIYQYEQYVLAERQNVYQVLLKVGATSHDLLKVMLHVCYLYQLQNGPWRSLARVEAGAPLGSPIEISYRLTLDKFEQLQQDLAFAGWTTMDGLVARPFPYRLLEASAQ